MRESFWEKYKTFFQGFRFLKYKEFSPSGYMYHLRLDWKVKSFISGNIRKAFLWENIRNFPILELQSSIFWNIRNFFFLGGGGARIFFFFELIRKCDLGIPEKRKSFYIRSYLELIKQLLFQSQTTMMGIVYLSNTPNMNLLILEIFHGGMLF